MGFGNIYYGLAKRALDQSIRAVKSKGSLALSRSMAYHPEIQHAIAEMTIELESIGPHLERIAEDWANGVDHGAQWPSKIFAAKYRAVEGSWRVVDLGLDVSGARGSFARRVMSDWSAMRVSAESIPRIPSSRMKWWRKPHWRSAWMNSPAGVSELFLKLIGEKTFKSKKPTGESWDSENSDVPPRLISPAYFSLGDLERKLRDSVKRMLRPVRDHRFAFPKIDETRNAQGPLNLPHTCQMACA